MPKVHFVKKARKDNAVAKKGESYYWWKFRYSGKRLSKTPPTRDQLTQSFFLKEVYAIENTIAQAHEEDDMEQVIYDIEALIEETQQSLDNMPEHLQETSDSGILLQDRIDALNEWIGEIQSLDFDIDESLSADERSLREEQIIDQINECMYGGE